VPNARTSFVSSLSLIACSGEASCQDIPVEREAPEAWAQSCVSSDDCPDDMLCVEGAAGGYYYFYDLTCTVACSSDDDCPVIQDETCGDGEYCSLVNCSDGGFCQESTCI
jgi:hypothetical protein